MRRTYRYLYIAAFASSVLAGCGERIPVVEEEHPSISFAPVPNEAESGVKSIISSQTALQNAAEGLGLFGTLSRNTNQTIFNNDHLRYFNSAWDYGYYLWWVKESYYNFAAVYPYTSDASSIGSGKASYSYGNSGATLAFSNITTNWQSPDLMYGFADRDLTSVENYSVVPIDLKHAFAAVEFKIVNASGSVVNSISDVALKNIITNGSLTAKANEVATTWTNLGARNDNGYARDGVILSSIPYSTVEHTLFNGAFVIVPQPILNSGARLLFNKDGGDDQNTVELNLSNIGRIQSWDAGKKYTYIITLQSTAITFTVSVVDWIEEGPYHLN